MFRAQANQFDEVVGKATDENLTSEDWGRILEVCDRVAASPSGPQQAVASLIKRLAHRNANVQLYTLELANALSQNCGPPLHRELASRSFTDALVRLANDRNTHQQVKTKTLERMEGWSEMFRGDPDLGIMEQAYERLKRSNPGLAPPSKPVKREMRDEDRKKEEEELQMALALSLREKPTAAAAAAEDKAQSEGVGGSGGGAQTNGQAAPAQAGTTAATVSRVRALYDFTPSETGELAFRKGDIIAVLESVYKDWWKGSLRGQTGIFPLNYVEKLQDPTTEELEHDAEMEGEVFSQIRNVEKLLALLSVRGEGGMSGGRDQGSEEEITELYHQTLAIRPKLIELIGKYSQKKDDFTQLNEKFIKARRDYEALLESSMSQPPAGYGYGQPPRQSHGYQTAYGQAPPQGYPPRGPQGFPPQGQPAQQRLPSQGAPPQGYPPQHAPPSQDPQSYYNQQPPQSQPQPQANAYSYPPSADPAGTPAPFHFMTGGAPPEPRQHTPGPAATPSLPQNEGAFTPKPSAPQSDRPQSVYTLNSGNPQELGTGGYESPTENRHQYPSQQGYPPQGQQYPPPQNAGPPPQQAYPPQGQMPLRQRQSSFDSPRSIYSSQGPPQDGQSQYPPPTSAGYPPQAAPSQPPPQQQHPGSPPPSGPPQQSGPYPTLNAGAPPQGAYQPYHPSTAPLQHQQQPQQQPVGGGSQWGGSQGGDDASDYYR